MTTKNLFQIAAMTAAFASASMAQTPLKAKVDFRFEANGKVMESGTYRVESTNSKGLRAIFILTNNETRKSILVPSLYKASAKPGTPETFKLVFQCLDGNSCKLAQVWDGGSDYAVIRTPGKKTTESDEFVEVAMTKASVRGL